VDKRERQQILGERGVGDPSPLQRADERRLAEDLADSPLRGLPLRRRRRNFRPPVDTYVVSLGGPLAYMRRLREIEDEMRRHEERLTEARAELAAAFDGDAAAFAEGWRALAAGWEFSAVNELIERHNRFYPAESRLPMDPRTGDFVPAAGKPYRREPLGADWILERFPAEPGRATP
jgi:hypothetical protein